MNPFSMTLLAGVCAAGACSAQVLDAVTQRNARSGPDASTVAHESVIARSIGLQAEGRDLRGSADRYEIVFDADSPDFLPSLGKKTDRPHGLEFELESIHRTSGTPRRVVNGTRTRDGMTVRYERPWFDERYEVRPEGVEQSFLLRRLPDGAGDLIVRMRVTTDLEPSLDGTWTDGGLNFALAGRDVATVGAVTGIDANGVTQGGAMRFVDGHLELRLPAEFVDSAALPLLVDPLIGSAVTVAGGTFNERDVDIAYDADADLYLLVWTREISGRERIRGQRVRSNGQLLGSTIQIESGDEDKSRPRVANINSRDAFVVVWDHFVIGTGFSVRGNAVTTGGALLNNSAITIAFGSNSALRLGPDVGGASDDTSDLAMVVWTDAMAGNIEGRQVRVSPNGFIQVSNAIREIAPTAGFNDSQVSISPSAGEFGNYLVVWSRNLGRGEIRGQVLDGSMNEVGPTIAISRSTGLDDQRPVCDGDGRQWVVAWDRSETDSSFSDRDIICRGLALNNAGNFVQTLTAEIPVEADVDDYEISPSVAWTGDSALIAFADQNGTTGNPNMDAYIVAVDPFTCDRCRNEYLLAGTTVNDYGTAIASALSAGGAKDLAMAAWMSRSAVLNVQDGQIMARRWDSQDGIVTDLGGGCGGGGEARATCAVRNNPGFAHRLRRSDFGNATAALILGFERIDLPCGPCVLVPNPLTGFAFAASTDVNGNAQVSMPIPNSSSLVGLVFYDQWFVQTPSPVCGPLGHDFSNAIRVEIQ